MIRVVLLALVLLPLPALAQSASPPSPVSQPAPAATASELPLAAMRHHEPSKAEVESREEARFGKTADKERQTQDREIDRLYQDVIRRSEAPAAQHP